MTAIEKARKIVQKNLIKTLYEDTVTVYVYQKTTDLVTHITSHGEKMIYKDIPCRLSFPPPSVSSEGDTSIVIQNIVIFLSSDVKINPGSKIIVTHLNETVTFKNSGKPAKYPTHQEISLKLFDGWA